MKQIGKTLPESSLWYMSILEGVFDGILVADIRTKMIKYSNFAICAMLGYTVEEFGQMSIQQIHPESAWFHVLSEFEALAREEKKLAADIPCLRKDGVVIYTDITSTKIMLDGLECNVGIFRDITKRKQAEELLKKSEERFRQIAGSVVDWIWEVDVSGLYTYASSAVERILGYTSEEIVGQKHFYDFFAPDIKEVLKGKAFDVFARKEAIYHLINRNVHKDGHVVVLETTAVPVLDGEGNLLGYRGADTDITANTQVEKALKDGEQILKSVVQGNPIPQFVIDKDHRVVYWNRALEVISGVKADEVLGTRQQWKAFYDSERPCMADLLLDGAFQNEITYWYQGKECKTSVVSGAYEATDFFPHQGKAGAWLRFTATLIRDSTGCVIGAVETLEDITERKKAEEEIRELNIDLERRVAERTAQLVAANKELESFSYSVSHDLRAPLRGIDGWSLALLEDCRDKLNKEALEYLYIIRSETQRMGRLIDDLLRMSHITRAEMNVMPINVSEIVLEIVARLQEANPNRQIEFVIQPELKDRGDERLIEIALTNLLDNAVKFTSKKESALIEFGQTKIDGRPVYFIRDNGAGFEMEYARKLFVAFQRIHPVSEFPGTGIGLTLVYNIINRHGGKIWADAKVGQGVTFYFALCGGTNDNFTENNPACRR